MKFYAQVDENGVCVAVSQIYDAIAENVKMINLEVLDTGLIGKRWDGVMWHNVPQYAQIPEPTQLDRIETLLNEVLGRL